MGAANQTARNELRLRARACADRLRMLTRTLQTKTNEGYLAPDEQAIDDIFGCNGEWKDGRLADILTSGTMLGTTTNNDRDNDNDKAVYKGAELYRAQRNIGHLRAKAKAQ